MKSILAGSQREVLEELSRSNVLLCFDYDGTLTPIVKDPSRAVLSKGMRKTLRELAQLYPCIVLSGRSVADVERKLEGIELRGIIGNHGLEPWGASAKVSRAVRGWKRRLEAQLGALPGVRIEDKLYSLSIHFRAARRKKRTKAAIERALAELDGVRLVGGKQVFNVLPEGAPHKGLALERERRRLGCDKAFFIGDDETDEDVFDMGRPGRLVTVRVGKSRDSRATYCVRSQAEVEKLLERFVRLRSARARPRRKSG